VELDEGRFALCVDESEGVDSKSLHHAIASWDCSIGHRPHEHVGRFRHQRCPVPESVMSAACLRKGSVGFHLYRVYEIGKFDRVLDKEDWNIVANKIPVAVFGVKLYSKSPHVPRGIDRACASGDGGEPSEQRRLFTFTLKKIGARNIRERFISLEKSMRGRSARMDDAFGYALVIEMENLLSKNKIL
jgi:hypothetical protein